MTDKEKYEQRIKLYWPQDAYEIIKYDPYPGKFIARCMKCGKIKQYSSPYSVKSKINGFCQKCYPHNKAITIEVFQKRINDHFVDQSYTVLEFAGVRNGALIKCNKCGREFFYKDCAHITRQKTLCKHCYPVTAFGQHTVNSIQEQIDSLFGTHNFKVLSYDSDHKKIQLQHKCGFIFNRNFQRFKESGRCPKCNKTDSRGELAIANVLMKFNIPFITEKSFPDLCGEAKLLRFDFFVDNKFLIEYQGQQHYESIDRFGGDKTLIRIMNNDMKKEEYCKDHNIPLLKIPYWKFKEIQSIILDFLKFNDYPIQGVESSDSK